MTKFIAVLMLTVVSVFCSLGNYWFTFGLWPRSWGAFFLFWVLSYSLLLMTQLVFRDKQ